MNQDQLYHIRYELRDAMQDALRDKASFTWIESRIEEPKPEYRRAI